VGQAVTSTKTLLRHTDIKSILVEEKIMKTKIRRFSKSMVSILLSLMMLFSCVVTSGAVTVEPEKTVVTLDAASENAAVALDNTANADDQTTAQPVALENEKMNADIQESGANVDIKPNGDEITVYFEADGINGYARNSYSSIELSLISGTLYQGDFRITDNLEYSVYKFKVNSTYYGRLESENKTTPHYLAERNSFNWYTAKSGSSGGTRLTAPAGQTYRVVFDTSNRQYRFFNVDVNLNSGDISTTENGSAVGWGSNDNKFNRVSANDYQLSVYFNSASINSSGGFKLYSENGSNSGGDKYLTNASSAKSISPTKGSTLEMHYKGGNANAVYLNGSTGHYKIHYNPNNYVVWVTPYKSITTNGTHCTINVTDSLTTASATDTVSFTITPDNGYILNSNSVSVSGGVTDLSSSSGTYTFTMPYSDVTISAECVQNSNYSDISVKSYLYDNATTFSDSTVPEITVANAAYTYGTTFGVNTSIALTAQESVTVGGTTYKFFKWTDNQGNDLGSSTNLTYVPTANNDYAIAVYHKAYTITCETPVNGTIEADSYNVAFDASYTITATPEEGYVLNTITVDGTAVTPTGNVYNGTMPPSNIEVAATFKSDKVRIYFYDTLDWGQTWVFAHNSNGTSSYKWPGVMMQPDPTYYNLYYYDFPYNTVETELIFGNRSGDRGGQTWSISTGGLSTKEGQVLVCADSTLGNFTYDGTDGEKINKILAAKCTWGTISNGVITTTIAGTQNEKSITLDKISSGKYGRVYFYNTSGMQHWTGKYHIFVQFYNAESNGTITCSNYHLGNYNENYFPGKALTPIEGNSNYSSGNLYYVDVPTDTVRISFNNGFKGNNTNLTAAKPYNTNKNGKVLELKSSDYGNDDVSYRSDGNVSGYLNNINFENSYLPDVATQVLSEPDEGEVTVYAKTGTVRTDFDKYSRLATVEVKYADGSLPGDGDYAYDKHYYESGGDTPYYKLEKANIRKNQEFKVKITVKAAYKSKYYVEAFIVNGKTVYPDVQGANTTTGEYTCTYTISDDETTPIEITPVYFYIVESGHENDYVTFHVEDYEAVKSKWGNTLCCYAWYDNDAKTTTHEQDEYAKSDPTNSANIHKPTLGGYPGQPMIYEAGSYYTQIPVTDDGGLNIMGVTLNNFFWDEVHKQFKDIDAIGGTRHTNCQTYDYDDFTSLLAVKTTNTIEDIIFTFKEGIANRNDGNNGGNVPAAYTYTGDEVTSTTNYALTASGVVAGNGYEALTDYYQYSIDLFGKRLTKDDLKENGNYIAGYYKVDEKNAKNDISPSYVLDNDCARKLTIVSDGYVTAEHDYIGLFGTKWYVYNNQTGEFLGALPPSAFYNDSYENFGQFLGYSQNAKTYKYTSGSEPASTPSADTQTAWGATDDAWEAWTYYKTLKNSYRNYPVQITYESDLQAGARVIRQTDTAWRADGRWYYSKVGETIYANIVIEYGSIDPEDSTKLLTDENGTVVYKKDVFDPTNECQGTVTTAETYFTGVSGKRVSLTGVTANKNEDFTFTADLMKIKPDGTIYEFRGWYYTNNYNSDITKNTYNKVTDKVNGSKAKRTNSTFIARYLPVVSSDEITITHMMYKNKLKAYTNDPEVGGGLGTPSVMVRVLDASGNPIRTVLKTEGLAKISKAQLTYSSGGTTARYLEVTLYNENYDPIEGIYRDTTSAYSKIYNPSLSENKANDTYIVTTGDVISDFNNEDQLKYVYNISDFLLNNGNIKSDKKQIYYYSNYQNDAKLVISHKLLSTLVDPAKIPDGSTEAAELAKIVGLDGNTIMPHYDFYSTQTQLKVEIVNTSTGKVVTTLQDTTIDPYTLKPSDLTGYTDGTYSIKVTLTANPRNGTPSEVDFYNRETTAAANGTENTIYYKPTEAAPFLGTADNNSAYTYTIPVTTLYNTSTSSFAKDELSFFSDPKKLINAKVKYYDRNVSDQIHSLPADINHTATTVDISYYVSFKNTIAAFEKESIAPNFSKIDNILDEHCYWITQSAAVDGIGNTKDFHNSTDKSTSTTGVGVCKYSDDTNADLSYHTDYYGRAKGTSLYKKLKDSGGNFTVDDNIFEEAKWVSYTNNGTEVDGSDGLTPADGFGDINGVTIWCYNQPKKYSFTAYYTPASTDTNGNELVAQTDLVLTRTVTVSENDTTNKSVYLCGENNNTNAVGFYNQRLGIPDTSGNPEANIDGYCDYLAAYGITNPYFGCSEAEATTGIEIKAVKYAKTSSNDDTADLIFDGWYIHDSQGYHRVSSERFYQNRVVNDIELYAGYVPKTSDGTEVGTAVTLNGVDHYVNASNKRMVRFNTQLNIYGDSVVDSDPYIQNVAAIYFSMPTKDVNDEDIDWNSRNALLRENLAKASGDIRTQLINHKDLLNGKLNNGNRVFDTDGNDWYHTYTRYDTKTIKDLSFEGLIYKTKPKPFTIDWYAYEVGANPDKANHVVKLTNKNRIQFYFEMEEEKYNNLPFLAYVAVKYGGEWYISNNFVSNITYTTNDGQTVYFHDYNNTTNAETKFNPFVCTDALYASYYKDEIGIEDNGEYIEFTDEYEETQAISEILLE